MYLVNQRRDKIEANERSDAVDHAVKETQDKAAAKAKMVAERADTAKQKAIDKAVKKALQDADKGGA